MGPVVVSTQGKVFSPIFVIVECRLQGGGEPAWFHSISQEGTQSSVEVQHIDRHSHAQFSHIHEAKLS